MTKSRSTVLVGNAFVQLVCEEGIAWIKEWREKERDKHIREQMKRKKYIWFGPTYTYEEAKKCLDEDHSIHSDYPWIDLLLQRHGEAVQQTDPSDPAQPQRVHYSDCR